MLRLLAGGMIAPGLGGCDQIAGFVVSEEEVRRLGLETWRQLQAEHRISRSAAAAEAVQDVSGRLIRAAGGSQADWEIQVFEGPTVNAFALPGGKIGIFEGMLEVTADEGGLAAVIGHEIGHVQAAHSAERIRAEVARTMGLQVAAWLLEMNEVPFSREIAGLLGVGTEFGLVRPYGRRQELEADRLGVFLMAEAGFDPRRAAAVWERMSQLDLAGPPAILSTHPAPEARVEAIREMIPEALEAARSE